jgi:hypothetical protein
MLSELDATNWSGEGSFTQIVIDRLRELEAVRSVRVEDAPATRSEADYNFISNEIFVEFTTTTRREPIKRFGILPATRSVEHKSMTIADLEKRLAALDDIGEPDYADEGMLQYLRAERVVPAYQTRGYKLVELLRIYEAGTPSRA